MLYNVILQVVSGAAVAVGAWMGQYFRTAATVPDEAPQRPDLDGEHLLPTFLAAQLLARWTNAGLYGTILLSFNLAVVWSFLLGNEQSRRWLKRAHRG